jgi:hypothetical protein
MSVIKNNINFKNLFDEKIKKINFSVNSMAIANEENYEKIINGVLEAKHRKNKTSLDYRRLNRYDIIKVVEVNKLIFHYIDQKIMKLNTIYIIMKYMMFLKSHIKKQGMVDSIK